MCYTFIISLFMNTNNDRWFNCFIQLFRRNANSTENNIEAVIPTYNYTQLSNAHKYQTTCLNCNRSNIIIIKGNINPNRTCVICFENNDVCYGCDHCIRNNLPSCCEKCYNDIINISKGHIHVII